MVLTFDCGAGGLRFKSRPRRDNYSSHFSSKKKHYGLYAYFQMEDAVSPNKQQVTLVIHTYYGYLNIVFQVCKSIVLGG